MFPLYSSNFPATATELARLLNASLGRVFAGAPEPVSLRAEAYPEIAELRLTLDGAELRSDPPQPPMLNRGTTPALTIEQFEIRGTGIAVGAAEVDLYLSASGVCLGQTRDDNHEVVLVLQSASEGKLEIDAAREALERAIAELAKNEAGKHGVAIDQVQLTLSARGDRGLDGEVKLRARKLFLSTTIQVAGKLDLDSELNATLSDVRCTGEGAMGSMACGFLQPHFEKVNGRSVSLLALPLGDVHLRDVRLSANERLTVTAEFGA